MDEYNLNIPIDSAFFVDNVKQEKKLNQFLNKYATAIGEQGASTIYAISETKGAFVVIDESGDMEDIRVGLSGNIKERRRKRLSDIANMRSINLIKGCN